jgi:3-hydroxybutyryl-CoA dehydrogenase
MATTDAVAAAPRFVAVGAGRMGRGIAIAFAWAGHRIALVDLRRRSGDAWRALRDDARAEIDASLLSLAELGAVGREQVAADRRARRARRCRQRSRRARCCRARLRRRCRAARRQARGVRAARRRVPRRRDPDVDDEQHPRHPARRLRRSPGALPQRALAQPAYVIPVVELSTHAATAPAVLARTKALLESIGKVAIVCGPTPGYIVPRLQALVMNEAARMVEEGAASAEEIDKATRFGLGLRFAALGVVEFIDVGGADILHHASRELAASVDAARYAAPAIVGAHVAANKLGLKTGDGFYDYGGRDHSSPTGAMSSRERWRWFATPASGERPPTRRCRNPCRRRSDRAATAVGAPRPRH